MSILALANMIVFCSSLSNPLSNPCKDIFENNLPLFIL